MKQHSKTQALSGFDRALFIIQTVAKHFGRTLKELEGPGRPWSLVWPRWVAIAMVHKYTGLSHDVIGAILNRDIQTVTYALRSLQLQVPIDKHCAASLAAVDAVLARTLTPMRPIGPL